MKMNLFFLLISLLLFLNIFIESKNEVEVEKEIEIKNENENENNEIFQLPSPEDIQSNEKGLTKQLKFGESISMDELGPIIINPDGTMRRIANWNELTKGEQESTFRQIVARNKRRLAALKEQQELQELKEKEKLEELEKIEKEKENNNNENCTNNHENSNN